MVFDLHGIIWFPLLWTTPMSKRFWLLLRGATSISGPTVFFWICFDALGQTFLVDSHCLDMGLEILPKKTRLCSSKKTGSLPLWIHDPCMENLTKSTQKKSTIHGSVNILFVPWESYGILKNHLANLWNRPLYPNSPFELIVCFCSCN